MTDMLSQKDYSQIPTYAAQTPGDESSYLHRIGGLRPRTITPSSFCVIPRCYRPTLSQLIMSPFSLFYKRLTASLFVNS